jgi:hypothetical protein
MRAHAVHAREIAASTEVVFAEIVALGTPADRIWPAPRMPFRRSAGEPVVGVTRERHGIIRAVLVALEPGRHMVWRARQPFLEGTHAFTVTPGARGGSLVEHALDARLAWWFAPIWRFRIAAVHDRIVGALLERLALVCEAPADPARRPGSSDGEPDLPAPG